MRGAWASNQPHGLFPFVVSQAEEQIRKLAKGGDEAIPSFGDLLVFRPIEVTAH